MDSNPLPDPPKEEKQVCTRCGKPSGFKCAGCHVTSYCSKTCQIEDWTQFGHKLRCKQLASSSSSSSSAAEPSNSKEPTPPCSPQPTQKPTPTSTPFPSKKHWPWPWSPSEEQTWGQFIALKYGQLTDLDRRLHLSLIKPSKAMLSDAEFGLAMRRRMGLEPFGATVGVVGGDQEGEEGKSGENKKKKKKKR